VAGSAPGGHKGKAPDPERWFSDWFQEDYLTLYQHRDTAEARGFLDRILPELDLRPPDWVLDLACGAGRHSHYLVEKGFRVVGFDLSRPLLLKASGSSRSSPIVWVQGDMRSISVQSKSMSAAVNLFTSFGYFLDDRDNIAVLREISRVLKSKGWLVLDTLNPNQVETSLVSQSRYRYPSDQKGQPDLQITEERAIDREKHRVVKTINVRRGSQTKRFVESVRMYSVDELNDMLRSVSLNPILLWGDYQGADYHSQSSRIIIGAQANADDTI